MTFPRYSHPPYNLESYRVFTEKTMRSHKHTWNSSLNSKSFESIVQRDVQIVGQILFLRTAWVVVVVVVVVVVTSGGGVETWVELLPENIVG